MDLVNIISDRTRNRLAYLSLLYLAIHTALGWSLGACFTFRVNANQMANGNYWTTRRKVGNRRKGCGAGWRPAFPNMWQVVVELHPVYKPRSICTGELIDERIWRRKHPMNSVGSTLLFQVWMHAGRTWGPVRYAFDDLELYCTCWIFHCYSWTCYTYIGFTGRGFSRRWMWLHLAADAMNLFGAYLSLTFRQ